MERENNVALLEDKKVRRIWYDDQWWFSVIDIIEVVTESKAPQKYWYILKKRTKELSTICRPLKLVASDGKERLTDVANTEGVFRIILNVPSPKAESLKIWLVQVGQEAIDNVENPYEELLLKIKIHIEEAQTKAIITVNNQLLQLYWRIGNFILTSQNQSDWGSKIVTKLSKDLKIAFPNMSGLSERNLKYMRKFAKENPNFEFVQESLAQITWYHNQTLMDKNGKEKQNSAFRWKENSPNRKQWRTVF